ncbi:MAG: IclR family transcriptional regulator [Pseudomonadota bacterium]
MDPRKTRSRPGVDAVDRAIAILVCFEDGPAPLSLADLAQRSSLNKSTILRLCASLLRGGLLSRDTEGRYRIGPTLGRLGAQYRADRRLPLDLRPTLRALCHRTGETASFYVRDGGCRVCLLREEPARAIRHALREGAALPLTYGASALVLRAFGPDPDPALEAVRIAGHAVTRGARDPDVAAVAVPVRQSDDLLGVLALSGPIQRFDPPRTDAMLRDLRRTAAELAP